MRVIVCFAGILGAVPQAIAFPQDPPSQKERVNELVRGLESKDVRMVYRSLERLTELGGPGIAEIERRAAAETGHVRSYLRWVVDDIRATGGLPARYWKPRRVTLSSTDRNVSELLSDLQGMTGLVTSGVS